MALKLTHPTDKANFSCLEIGHLTIWFSYETPIAYHDSNGFVIRENDWGPTTGKHLNSVNSDHDRRISGAAFELGLAGTIFGLGMEL